MTGLAAMGACCSSCEFEGALAIGVIAALMNLGCEKLLQLLDVDDASGAISIHVVGGAWGLFAAGLLTSQQGYADSFASSYGDGVSRSAFCRGAFYGGRGNQLGANIVFILATISWSWALTLASTLPFKLLWPSHFAVVNFDEDAQRASSVLENSKLAEVKRENASLVKLQTTPASPLPPIVRTPAKETPASKVDATADPKNNEKKKPGSSLMSSMMLKTAARGAMSFKKGDKTKGEGAKEEIEVGELEAYDTLEEEEAFEKENGYSWDLAIVFKAPTYPDGNPKQVISFTKDKPHTAKNPATGEEEPIMTPAEIITNLSTVGLHTRCFHSLDKKYMICKIRAPLSILKACADIGDVKLLLDEEELKRQAEAGWSGIHNEKMVTIKPMKISYGWEEQLTTYTPYEYIYSTFDDPDAVDEEMGDNESDVVLLKQPKTDGSRSWPSIYARSKNLKHGVSHGFGAVQRIKLLHGILTHTGEKGCGLDLRKLQEEHEQILGCFPLHDAETVELLRERWLGWNVMPWSSPWKRIKEYFGEKIGLYFMFLGHYCSTLGTVSFLGFFVVIHLIVVGVQNNSLFESLRFMYSIPPYCFFITLWSQWFLETWVKKEKNVALQWGMVGFESTEETRPEYQGKLIDSWIDGQPNAKAFSRVTKNTRLRLSTSLLTNITCIVVGVFAATFYLKLYFKTRQDMMQYTSLADIINAVTIMCLDAGYKVFAVKMTDFENHRTDTKYEDAIILKLFVFGFFNSYCPSIYIAFLKTLLGDECNYNSCMGELGQSLMIIFVSRLLTGLVMKILIPQTRAWWHRWFEDRRLKASEAAHASGRGAEEEDEVMTSTEDQFNCKAYTDVFDDYNELSVQFGYICLFAPAFPLSPLLAFVSNFCEIRADGYKLLKQMRRPWPHGAEDVGTWYYIFQTLTVLSVFSNAGIIFYTMDLFDTLEREFRLGLFIAYICGTLILRSFFTSMIEAYPEEVDIQLARQEVLVQKVIKREPDEDVFADMLRMRRLRMKPKTRVSILHTDPREQQSKKHDLETFEEQQKEKTSCCVS
jgi:anoctamin-10/anoctamin-7